MYVTYVRPLLEYCVIVRLPSQFQQKLLDDAQKFILRNILKCRTDYLSCLTECKLESLKTRREKRILTLVMKSKVGSESISSHITKYLIFETSGPTSRNGIMLKPPKFRLKSTNTFYIYMCSIFNSLPLHLRNSFNYSQFFKDLDLYYGVVTST